MLQCTRKFALENEGRLTEPMCYDLSSDKYLPVTWDEAFALAGRHFRELDSPDCAAFYTSGRLSNEATFLYQLFAREFGTNNLPDCSNMCHEASGRALTAALGTGKGTVDLTDWETTDCLIVMGVNAASNAPRMLTSLAKAYRRRAQIRQLGEVYRQSRSAIISWCLGVTQQEHAVDTVREIVNVLLLRGNIGREGAGPCPIRGHSNVQGNRTCGIDHRPDEAWLARMDKACGITSPRKHGLDTVRVIPAMARGDVRIFVGMGGNFALAAPDPDYTFPALQIVISPSRSARN
jgi:anaerobic selenocysteine-containing dehydrogenase